MENNKRVIQISVEILAGSDADGVMLAQEVHEELEKHGYTVLGADFKADMTNHYKRYYPELMGLPKTTMDRVKFRFDDDEYVLHICQGLWKRFHIYKPKEWTDATGYFEAWSDDGKVWCFGSQSDIEPIETEELVDVVQYLKVLNKDKRYKQQYSIGCCGSSEHAKDFERIYFGKISEIL